MGMVVSCFAIVILEIEIKVVAVTNHCEKLEPKQNLNPVGSVKVAGHVYLVKMHIKRTFWTTLLGERMMTWFLKTKN